MEGIASNELRVLSSEEKEKLTKQDDSIATEFKKMKLEAEAQKNWDLFYKRNSTKFFRDRHWTVREFEELVNFTDNDKILLEVGCGVGNFLFPLLEEKKELYIYACDFSPRAVEFVKNDSRFQEDRMKAFTCDITKDSLTATIPECHVDVASLIFVLSAIHPDNFLRSLQSIASVMKSGGLLVFRDYGLYDMAQIRFGRGNKLADNFYVRQDGTRSYFFTVDGLKELVNQAGFDVVSCHYVHRRTVNKKEGVDEPRVFVQGRFSKR